MTIVTRSAEKAKDEENNSSSTKDTGGKAKNVKGSVLSSPTTVDKTALRRSARESPLKKQDPSSTSSSLRKSERLEKRSALTMPTKMTSNSGKKRSMPSPPRLSMREDKRHCSRSSSSKKAEKSGSSSGSRESKKSAASLRIENTRGKGQGSVEKVASSMQELEKKKKQIWRGLHVKSENKRTLDARTYRKMLSPQAKELRNLGNGRHPKGENRLSQGDDKKSGNSELKKDEEGGMDERSCQKVEECEEMNLDEGGEPAAQLSICSEARPSIDTSKEVIVVEVSATTAVSEACTTEVPIADTCSFCGNPKRVNFDSEIQEKNSFCEGKCLPVQLSSCQEAPKQMVLFENSGKDETGCISLDEMMQQSSAEAERLHPSLDFVDESHPSKEDRKKYLASAGLTEEVTFPNSKQQESLLENQKDDLNACVKCKLGGRLLCCDAKGCSRSYHLCCLNPPLLVVPLGAWHCPLCVVKKMELGVHSISLGIEAILDFREIEDRGKLKKQYFVRYKGLAHVHNRWVQEKKLLEEVPVLIDRFNKKCEKNKAVNYNSGWMVPQRLLRKRSILSLKEAEHLIEPCHEIANIPCEWLVKWKGLGYEDATWELENASFLNSTEAMILISDYERRIRKAKEKCDHQSTEKLLEARKGSVPKVSELPGIAPMGQDNDYIIFVNKILERWYKYQNAIVIDDKERILKTIFFLLSLRPYVPLPALVISTSPTIIQWEAEFMRLDPSLNVVLYTGNKNVRSNIQTLEFYEEGGGVMLEVLLSTPKAIIEDLDSLQSIGRWGVIVVDDLQGSRMWEHLEQITILSSDFKLLLASGQMKDGVPEHSSILSFLGVEKVEGLVQSDNTGSISSLREKLSQLVAYEHKTGVSKFLEYWVPVPLSDVQLEQYCCTLVENFMSLRSCLKSDPVGALSNVLASVRKCCQHPYLLSLALQSSLTKDLPALEYLHVGINASGKLKFLDRILSEMKNHGKRVLVLFQSIVGSEKTSIGDILDDFLRQRFGEESYERIDGGLVKGKRDAALNMFNNIKGGRFAFLLENRACRSCIKLSSIDAVIIYGSDWNPVNDLRALLRIDIDSGSEQVKVLRLYSPCTVEEKMLMLVNQDSAALEYNLQNMNPATSHTLLTWGASYLFRKLDEFQNHNSTTTSEASPPGVELNDVVSEVLGEVDQDIRTKKDTNKPLLTKVQYNGTAYIRDSSLVGELEMQLNDDDASPTFFWCKLLEGRFPQWRYLSESSQRIRKKTKYYDEYKGSGEFERVDTRKKRQKSANSTVEPISLQTWHEDLRKAVFREKEVEFASSRSSSPRVTPSDSVAPKKGGAACVDKIDNGMKDKSGSDTTPSTSSTAPEPADVQVVESEGSRKLRDTQRALYVMLKPEISRLCRALQLPDTAKDMAEMLLEYIMNNHQVNPEQKTMLWALLIAVCWRAASLTTYNIDHQESLLVAKKLGFECKEQEIEFAFVKLQKMKFKFPKGVCLPENFTESNSQKKQAMEQTNQLLAKNLEAKPILQQEPVGETREGAISHNYLIKEALDDHLQVCGTLEEACKRVEQVCRGRAEKICKKQQEEVVRFNKLREEIIAKLKKKHGSEVCLSMKLNKLLGHINKCYKVLIDKQQEARLEEKRIKARWLQEAKSGSLGEFFDELPLSETGFDLEEMRISSEQIGVGDDFLDVVPTSGTSIEVQCADSIMSGAVESIGVMEVSSTNPAVDSHNDKLDHVLSGGKTTTVLNQNGLVRNKEPPCVTSSEPNHIELSASRHNKSFLTQEVLVEHQAASGGVQCVDASLVVSSQVEQHIVNMEPSQLRAPISLLNDVLHSHERPNCSHQVEMATQQSVDCSQQLNTSEGSQMRVETSRADPVRPGVIPEYSSHPQQAPHVNATQRLQSIFADPLRNEMEKLVRQKEIETKMADEEKNRLNSEREREIEEINKKYNGLVQDLDGRLQQAHKIIDMNHYKVHLNHILAGAYQYISSNQKPPLQTRQGSLPTTQFSPMPYLVPQTIQRPARMVGPSSLHQAVRCSSAHCSGDSSGSHQLPVIPRTPLQVGVQLRATPPHLLTNRPIINSAAPIRSSSLSATQLLMEMDGGSRSSAQNLLPAYSGPSFDAWAASKEGQNLSRPPGFAVGDGGSTAEESIVVSDDE